jgi:hypothetical protein
MILLKSSFDIESEENNCSKSLQYLYCMLRKKVCKICQDIYRTDHDLTCPTITGHTSLTSIVKR